MGEVTNFTDGHFVIDALPDDTYGLIAEGYYFTPTVTVEISNGRDVTGQVLLAYPLPEDPEPTPSKILYESPTLLDVAGVPHLVYARNGQMYHTVHNGSGWTDAFPIPGAQGRDPNLLYAPTLPDETSLGLTLFWHSGITNETRIMYAAARPDGQGGWDWSQPATYSDTNVASDNHDAVIDANGSPVVVWQMVDRENIEDDTDLYYNDDAIDSAILDWADIEAILTLDQIAKLDNGLTLPIGTPVALTRSGEAYVIDSAALTPLAWGTSINYDFDFEKEGQVPGYIPYIGGQNRVVFNATLNGQANESEASAEGSIGGEVDMFQERATGSVGGDMSANWKLDQETCRFNFNSAQLTTNLGVTGRFPIYTFGLGSPTSSIAKVEVGVTVDGQLTGTIKWARQGGNSFSGNVVGTISLVSCQS